MTSLERHWRAALLAAVLPPGERLPALEPGDADAFWAEFGAAAPRLVRLGFRVAVVLLAWLPLFRYGRPLHRLDPARQEQFLNQLQGSRSFVLRQLVSLVKLVACFALFRSERVQAAVRGAP